jgi:hypothetical protein
MKLRKLGVLYFTCTTHCLSDEQLRIPILWLLAHRIALGAYGPNTNEKSTEGEMMKN